jgi:molybdopterin-guanine dinucleotide biosynthesis protein A
MSIAREQITAGILAGGAGRRLGGIDKGWFELAGQSLIRRTIARIAPQCGAIVISANRSLARYRALGYPVCADGGTAFCGPLAGIAAVLAASATPYVLTVPVDTPLLPTDLAERLTAALHADTEIAVACCSGRSHRLHALMRRDLLANLQAALANGTRAVHAWQAGLDQVMVAWSDSAYFANINNEDDAAAIADWL